MSNVTPHFTTSDLVDQKLGHAELGRETTSVLSPMFGSSRLFQGEFGRTSTTSVFRGTHDLQMRWIHASGLPTQMIDLHPRGDRPDLLFVHGSMHVSLNPVQTDQGVAPVPFAGFRNPARRVVATIGDCIVTIVKRQFAARRHWVTSLGGVARWAAGRKFRLPALYLAMTQREVF